MTRQRTATNGQQRPGGPRAGCSIVPPYLLQQLARRADPTVAATVQQTLAQHQQVRARRELRATRWGPGRSRGPGGGPPGLIPPYLPTGEPTATDVPGPDRLQEPGPPPPTAPQPTDPQPPAGDPALEREVYDAEHGTALPGVLVRSEGEQPSPDESVNEAYDGLGLTWQLLHSVYGRDSLDDQGMPLLATVHYGQDYDNAFWDGVQMVFGDGDGVYFSSFTDSVDVIGHELAHGLTQHTVGLTYVGQSGALNESVSDVFGSLVKQMALGQTAEQADWLIGASLFTDRVNGVALRSMKAPGTAYDDPYLGTDPQPADMDAYVDLPHDSANDNGGVHINSGIPNRAFHLAAVAIGGHAWERAGQIWYDVITAGGVPKDVDFGGFAHATVEAAAARYGADGIEHQAVRQAWATVKVLTGPEGAART